MKILFITSSKEDYLSDGVLHGLKTLYKIDCIDYPRADILYKDCNENIRKKVRGFGFTLYSGLLEEDGADRFNIEEKIKKNYFDLIIIGNIWRQFGFYYQFKPWLKKGNTIILDGEDNERGFPAAGQFIRNSSYWLMPNVINNFLYFKREWTERTVFNLMYEILPSRIYKLFFKDKNIRKINFSIPFEKIINDPEIIKIKKFSKHIVDPELASLIPESSLEYAFENEMEYYKDLQESKFGITTKRAGWDCLRHYEIAANGCVPCFKNLHLKPQTCAPHGLNDGNCIAYTSAEDLLKKIDNINDSEYKLLQNGALEWVKNQTTVAVAKNVLNEYKLNRNYI
ncbi:hypothetical protein [Polynucleobacter sp. P1-05-14]|uniref:hypothetical protein n=1 Tax=Polynucleobacter sp. P1-05-14 TaxID=1819732 RepID=UPI001C0CEB12|nr:hypothetical protein [Polynucleobacter sp. P1-05-14]MBU3548022.1 glycosyltransferase family 1 protein [Polynucleobacter sp. P1-05-14]